MSKPQIFGTSYQKLRHCRIMGVDFSLIPVKSSSIRTDSGTDAQLKASKTAMTEAFRNPLSRLANKVFLDSGFKSRMRFAAVVGVTPDTMQLVLAGGQLEKSANFRKKLVAFRDKLRVKKEREWYLKYVYNESTSTSWGEFASRLDINECRINNIRRGRVWMDDALYERLKAFAGNVNNFPKQ